MGVGRRKSMFWKATARPAEKGIILNKACSVLSVRRWRGRGRRAAVYWRDSPGAEGLDKFWFPAERGVGRGCVGRNLLEGLGGGLGARCKSTVEMGESR